MWSRGTLWGCINGAKGELWKSHDVIGLLRIELSLFNLHLFRILGIGTHAWWSFLFLVNIGFSPYFFYYFPGQYGIYLYIFFHISSNLYFYGKMKHWLQFIVMESWNIMWKYQVWLEFLQENNRSELERIDRERHNDFQNMLRGFVVNQVTFIYLLFSVSCYIWLFYLRFRIVIILHHAFYRQVMQRRWLLCGRS